MFKLQHPFFHEFFMKFAFLAQQSVFSASLQMGCENAVLDYHRISASCDCQHSFHERWKNLVFVYQFRWLRRYSYSNEEGRCILNMSTLSLYSLIVCEEILRFETCNSVRFETCAKFFLVLKIIFISERSSCLAWNVIWLEALMYDGYKCCLESLKKLSENSK